MSYLLCTLLLFRDEKSPMQSRAVWYIILIISPQKTHQTRSRDHVCSATGSSDFGSQGWVDTHTVTVRQIACNQPAGIQGPEGFWIETKIELQTRFLLTDRRNQEEIKCHYLCLDDMSEVGSQGHVCGPASTQLFMVVSTLFGPFVSFSSKWRTKQRNKDVSSFVGKHHCLSRSSQSLNNGCGFTCLCVDIGESFRWVSNVTETSLKSIATTQLVQWKRPHLKKGGNMPGMDKGWHWMNWYI